jgi:hypothetical protein
VRVFPTGKKIAKFYKKKVLLTKDVDYKKVNNNVGYYFKT